MSDFFALRPFFTLRSLRAFWWIYILAWAFGLYESLHRTLTHLPGPMFYLWFRAFIWLNVALFPLSACAVIMTARLLLEVIISRLPIASRSADSEPDPLWRWQALASFIDLTPLVTRSRLEFFWWLFLVGTGWVLFENILLGPSKLNSVLGAVAYVAGVRLLFERAAYSFLPETAPAAEGGNIRPSKSYFSNFFSTRPFITAGHIKVFWWLYIVVELHRLYLRLATFTLVGSLPPSLYRYMWYNVFVAPLLTLMMITTVRLFLEVMLGPPEAQTGAADLSQQPRTLSDSLSDFINLRPFFTRARLQLFWWLFLFTIAADIYGYVSLVPGQQPILHWVPYVMDFLTPLYCVAGVRLLIDVVLRQEQSFSP